MVHPDLKSELAVVVSVSLTLAANPDYTSSTLIMHS